VIPLLVVAVMVAVVFALALLFALIALALRAGHARKARRRLALEEAWKPLLFRVLDGAEPSLLVSRVAPAERLFVVEFLFRYATRLTGMERDVIRESAAPFLPLLVARISGEGDPEQRARAVRTLGLLGGSEYLQDVVEALDDPSPFVALTATRTLALGQHPYFVDRVLDRLDRFQEWSPRFLASMLTTAGPAAAHALRQMLIDRRRPVWHRQVAADALAEGNDLRAAAVAAGVLATPVDRDLQCACLRLLERVGSGREAPAARGLVRSDDPMVRLCAISALGAIGGPQDLPALRSALDERDPWIALNAARALRELGDDAVLAILSGPEAWVSRLGQGIAGEPA
jgi:HEAT repeat protein